MKPEFLLAPIMEVFELTVTSDESLTIPLTLMILALVPLRAASNSD